MGLQFQCGKGWWLRTLVVLVLSLPTVLSARVNISPRPVNLTLNWTGTDLTVTQDFCVQSTFGANPADVTVIPYAVTVTVPFALVNGGQQIPVSLTWIDLRTGISTPLSSGASTGEVMTGDIANCPLGNNGRLVMFIANADITAVTPGFYTQAFDVTVSNSGGGRKSFTDTVTTDLTLPDSIAVTQLDDIDLGSYAGVDMSATESLCVFRGSGGNYGVTLTGSGPGGAFTLQRNASSIPYSVTWNDGSGPAAVTAGALLSARINGFAGSSTCNAGANNNATLGVTVLATDIDTLVTEAGSHSGTLTIMVEMQ